MQYLNDVVLQAAEQVQLAYAVAYSYVSYKFIKPKELPEKYAVTMFYNKDKQLIQVWHTINPNIQTPEDFIRALLPKEEPDQDKPKESQDGKDSCSTKKVAEQKDNDGEIVSKGFPPYNYIFSKNDEY